MFSDRIFSSRIPPASRKTCLPTLLASSGYRSNSLLNLFYFSNQHVYPWDYKVSELPRYWCNFSIPFLDFFAWLGWATDLKTVSDEMIRKRVLRTGDGSHRYSKEKADAKTAKELLEAYNNNNNNNEEEDDHVDTLWGWGELTTFPRVQVELKLFGISRRWRHGCRREEGRQDFASKVRCLDFSRRLRLIYFVYLPSKAQPCVIEAPLIFQISAIKFILNLRPSAVLLTA